MPWPTSGGIGKPSAGRNASRAATEGDQLNTRQAELDAERHGFEQQRQQWQAEQDAARRQWDAEPNELAARLADLESERNAFEADRRQWEQERAEAAQATEKAPAHCEAVAEAECPHEAAPQEPEFKTPSDGAPVDLTEVLRRVGASLEAEEEQARRLAWLSTRPNSRPASDEHRQRQRGMARRNRIDNYMSRLIQRVRSKSDEPGRTAAYAPPRCEPPSASQTQANVGTSPSAAAQPVPAAPAVAACQPVELSPRSAAPEKHIDLSAMRELANLSARTAISRHSRRLSKTN